MRRGRSGTALAGAGAIAPLAILLLASVVFLPSSGSSASGVEGAGYALMLTSLSAILAALIAGLSRWFSPLPPRWALALCGAVAAGGTTYVIAGLLPVGLAVRLGLAVGLGVGWGSVVAWLPGRQQPSRDVLIDRIPERDRVHPGASSPRQQPTVSAAPWSTSIRSPRMLRLAVFGAVVFAAAVGLSLGVAPWWWIGVLTLTGVAFCVAMLAWSRVRVSIDRDGLTIDSEVIGRALVHVRPTEILGVASTEIDPLVWGGWGLRWSGRHTAFVVAGGPGMVVHRSSGRALAIEIPAPTPTPDSGAAALRAIAVAAQSPSAP